MLAHVLQIEMLQTAITGIVKENHDDHYLGSAQCRSAVIGTFRRLALVLNGVFFDCGIKKLAEFICHKENFCNFALGEHSDRVLLS